MASGLSVDATHVSFSVRESRSQNHAATGKTSPRKKGVASSRKAPDPRLGVEQIEALLGECVQKDRQAIEEAFQSVDAQNEGNVHTSEFERVINHFFFPLSKDQHMQLIDRVGLNQDGTIDYDHFLKFLGGHATAKKLDPLKKAERAMNRPIPQQLSEADVESRVRHAVVSKPDTLLRAFRMHDRHGGLGRIRKDDFCQVLNSFVMVMTKEQFEKFWVAYDEHGDGFLSYDRFMDIIARKSGRDIKDASRKGVKPRVDHGGLLEAGQKLVSDPKAAPLQHIENQLRNLMKQRCAKLLAALRDVSDNKDGFVTLAQLKSAMDAELVPTSDQVFHAVLLSVGLAKVGDIIPFEDFIRRFMANEDRDVLAEAVTDKVSDSGGHVVGPDKGMDLETIMAVIRRDIPAGSAAVLAKFIKHDADRTGQVSSFELRNVLESYHVHLPESGFRSLMEVLDPRARGMIYYHEFLEHFAPKVQEDKKQWMNEVNYYNRARRPTEMTFKQFKIQLQDKMRAKGKPLSELFLEIDTNKDGLISPEELRVFLEENYLESSDENFDRLWQMCDLNRDGCIQFSEFLATMGLEINPGDLSGVSDRIAGGNRADATQRQNDQQKRMKTITFKSGEQDQHNYQLWQRAQRTLKQRSDSGQLKQAFEAFDSDHDGQISIDELVEMLHHMKVVEDDPIMDLVLDNVPRGSITVEEIPLLLATNPFTLPESAAENQRPKVRSSARPPAGSLNKGRDDTPQIFKRDTKKATTMARGGPQVMLTADEITERLREMVQLKFIDIHTAFRKFDTNLDGFINRKEFQKVMVDFHFKLEKAELEKLLTHIGMNAEEAVLKYEDFLKFFGAKEGSDAHRFLNSTHRYNIAHPPRSVTADQAAKQLPLKVADAFSTVREAYRAVDQDGMQCVQRAGLRRLLERFNIPMTDTEFEKLWHRYDTNDDGELQVDEFFASLGMEVSSTDTGASELIAQESAVQDQQHREVQQGKMAGISQKHKQAVKRMPAKEIGDKMRWKMEQERKTLGQIARQADINDDRVLSRQELLHILRNRGFDIDSAKLEKVLKLIGLDQLSEIPYGDFMNAFADTKSFDGMADDLTDEDQEVMMYTGKTPPSSERTSSIQSINARPAAPTPSSNPRLRPMAVHEDMSLAEFLPILQQHASRQQDMLREQLMRADRDRTGLIETRLLKSALTAHCGVRLTVKQTQALIDHARCSHRGKVSYNHFLDALGLPVCDETAHKLPGHGQTTAGERANGGGRPPFARRPSEERLRLPQIRSEPPAHVSPRPYERKAAVPGGKVKLPDIEESPGRPVPPDKLQGVLAVIRQGAQGRVKEMKRALRRLDPKRTGNVTSADFRGLLKNYGVDLSSHQQFRLQDAFDSGVASLQQSSLRYDAFVAACFPGEA